jgi:hypothetical protein
MGGMEVAQQAVVVPALPDFGVPVGSDLVAVAPGSDFATNAGVGSDVGEMVDEAVVGREVQRTPALEVATADRMGTAQIEENGGVKASRGRMTYSGVFQ